MSELEPSKWAVEAYNKLTTLSSYHRPDCICERCKNGHEAFILPLDFDEAINQACAEKDKRIAELEQINKLACQDWAEDDTAIRRLAKEQHVPEFEIDGDTYGVPGMVDVVESIIKTKDKEIERLKAEVKDWNYELERRIAEGTTIIRLESQGEKQRLAAYEALLEQVPHDRYVESEDFHGKTYSLCSPNCVACAYEAMKLKGAQ